MSALRYADPARCVHEPVVVHLPPLPAATPEGPMVTPGGGSDNTEAVRLTAWVHGRVQGVGFRWWTRSRALELGLAGTATNLDDGRVEGVAEGPPYAGQALLDALRGPGTPGRVTTVVERWGDARGLPAAFTER